MKKTIVTFLLFFCCISMLGAQPPGPSPWLGDVDANETVDILDALLTAKSYVTLIYDPVLEQNGDVNQDGTIDIIDALIIAQYYVGIIEYLPGDSIYGRTQKDLAKNDRKWEDIFLYIYQIEMQVQAFTFPYTDDTFVVNVDNTYVDSAFFKETGETAGDDIISSLVSIETLFDKVQETIDEGYIIHEIEFDDQFGYVSQFTYEISEDLEDDRTTYTIHSIRGSSDIQITSEDPRDLVNDFFYSFTHINIINDILILPVQYNGGCNVPEIILYAQDVFMESMPPQVNLYVYVETFGDSCLATPTEPLGFNLEPLADLHYTYYHSYDTIILNIYEYDLDNPVKHSIEYTPTMADIPEMPID
jgi:hypothetical protein